jgi:hypothetical protein
MPGRFLHGEDGATVGVDEDASTVACPPSQSSMMKGLGRICDRTTTEEAGVRLPRSYRGFSTERESTDTSQSIQYHDI